MESNVMRKLSGTFFGQGFCAVVRWSFAFVCVSCLLTTSAGIAGDDLATRREKVEALSLGEQQQLLRNQERFNELSAAEQQRLLTLHNALSEDANSAKLLAVLERYTEWLKNLPAEQRAELATLDADARIERIRRMLDRERQDQEGRRQRAFAGDPLPREDFQPILRWFGNVVWEHRDELLANAPPQRRAQQEKLDEAAQRRMLMGVAVHQWRRKPLPVKPEEIETLKTQLSSGTQDRLAKATPEQRDRLLKEFLWQAVMSRMGSSQMRRSLAMVSPDELERFFEFELSKEERQRLLSLPQDEMREELRTLYVQKSRDADGPPRGRSPGPQFGPPNGRDRARRLPGDEWDRPNRGGRPGGPGPRRERDRPPFDFDRGDGPDDRPPPADADPNR
jgi:hypothetical protein